MFEKASKESQDSFEPPSSTQVGVRGVTQSGTGTDSSSNPDFCTLALLSPKFVHR